MFTVCPCLANCPRGQLAARGKGQRRRGGNHVTLLVQSCRESAASASAATERMPRPTLRVPEALPAPQAHRHILEGTRLAARIDPPSTSRRRSASPPRNQAKPASQPPPPQQPPPQPRAAAAPYFVSRPTNTFANATSPGLITSRITKSQDLESLCALLETGGDFAGFQTIAISAAIHRLGKFACKHDRVHFHRVAETTGLTPHTRSCRQVSPSCLSAWWRASKP